MIQTLKHIVLCSSLLVVAGCADFFTEYNIQEDVPNATGTIISLRVACPEDELHISRAPQGGAYGDGFESSNQWSTKLKAINYDYKIQDLCLFIVDTNGDSVEKYLNTSDPDTPVFGAYYVENLQLESTEDKDDGHAEHPIDVRYLAKVNIGPVSIEPYFHRIIVVANVGDITNCRTVGALRDIVASQSYTPGTGGNIYINCYDDGRITASNNAPGHFAMGLYEEPSIIQMHKGTLEDPHVASVTLERLAARVDFMLTNFPSVPSQKKDPFAPIPYDVKVNKTGSALSRNWITHMRLVNAVEKPSYILRRTANSADGEGMKILGFEKADANHITTNYVIDPYTANKSSIPDDYFGNTELDQAYTNEFSADELVVSRAAFMSAMPGYDKEASSFAYEENSSHQYFIIGYTNENTLRPEDMTRNYTTGILYRSIYEPATIYCLNDTKDGFVKETKPLTENVLSDGTSPEGYEVGAHYGITFWMMERLVPNPTEADRLYLVADSEDDVRKLREMLLQNPEFATTGWTRPVRYEDGVAYNYYWIRHSNSQGTGHPFSPMEYSIVRNNIYSVSISSFSGPGAPSSDPSMDNPDRILPVTYVHKWHPYTVQEVGM